MSENITATGSEAFDFEFPVLDNENVRWTFQGGEVQPKFDGDKKVAERDTRENEETKRVETRYKMSFALSVQRPGELMPVNARLPLRFDMWLTDDELKRYAELVGTRVRPIGFHIKLYAPSGNGRFTPTALSASMKLDAFEAWSPSVKRPTPAQTEQK